MKMCPECDATYTDWVTTCTDCGAVLVDDDRGDDEPERVVYELGTWSLAAQSATAEQIAEAEIPHEWNGTDLTIDPEHEAQVDGLLAAIEAEHGTPSADGAAGEVVYDLTDWPGDRRGLLNGRLVDAEVPYRWEGDSLVIAEADEGLTEALLDEVEYGEEEDEDGGPEGAQPDDHTVDTLFLAAERLSSDPTDAHGLRALSSVLGQVHPNHPPFGFQRVAWRQIASSTDRLAGAIADGDEPSDDATAVAMELRLLLQPFV